MRMLIAAVVLMLAPSEAFAWGATGHRVTGALALPLLSAKAKAEIEKILGNETLAETSNWADEMRSSPEPFWQSTANPWHYATVPPGKTYAEVGAPPEGDSATALTKFAATLKDKAASREDKALALRFAVHIIGDLHQPLHVGNGADRGGNDVQVTFFGQPMNLHAVWDSGLVDKRELSFTEFAAFLQRRITPADAAAWNTPDPLVWIAESAALRDGVYPTSGQTNLSWRYAFQHRQTVDVRLMQGGVRMAAWLNAVYR
jgi:hypothetical protein